MYRADDWLYATRWEQLIRMRESVNIVEIITWNGTLFSNLLYIVAHYDRLWRVALYRSYRRRSAQFSSMGRRIRSSRMVATDLLLRTSIQDGFLPGSHAGYCSPLGKTSSKECCCLRSSTSSNWLRSCKLFTLFFPRKLTCDVDG